MGGVLEVSEDGAMDAAFLSEKLGRQVSSAKIREMDGKQGGISGATLSMVDIRFADTDETETYAVKTDPESKIARFKTMGLAREGLFYSNLAEQLDELVPKAYYSHGDMASGEKVMLMECFSNSLNVGLVFGPKPPHNWALTESLLASLCAGKPGPEEMSATALSLYAKMHARFWQDESLLQHTWLRGVDFAAGSDMQAWESSIGQSADMWKCLSADRKAGATDIKWDDHLVKCIDASFSKVSWNTFQEELRSRPWTLVHGDCHPGNALWVPTSDGKERMVLIDFEMIGIGSPSQEIGQYLISHMPPEDRRKCEKQLVQQYHGELLEELKSRGHQLEADAFTFERCWSEYVAGGAGRWVFFVPLLFELCGVTMGQFFHDQLAAFLKDHIEDSSTCPMPRF